MALILLLVSSYCSAGQVDSLKKVLKEHPRDSHGINAYVHLSVLALDHSYDSAVYLASLGAKIAESIGDDMGMAKALLRQGNAYNYKADYDSASWAYHKAVEVYKKYDDKLSLGKAYNNLGLMYRFQGNYPKSLEYLMESLKFKNEEGSKVEVGAVYQNIGIVFAIQQDFKTAEGYLEDALDIFLEAGDSVRYYSCLIDVSSMYRELGEYDRSREGMRLAYDYAKRSGQRTRMGICTYNMALSSYLQGDIEQAIKDYLEAKRIFTELGNKLRITGCNIRLSNIYQEQGLYAKAERICREGLRLFDDFSSPMQEYNLLKALSEVLHAQGKDREAYDLRLKYENLKDSISEEEQNLKLVELQTKYQKEINKREIAELTASNKQSQLTARKREVENYVLIGILILASLLAAMLYSRSRNKKRVNDALRQRNQVTQHALEEKEVLLREIHHRVQNNLQFVSSMLNLQARRVVDENTLNVLKECKLRIQSMALIHQKLYQEESLNGIDFSSYANNLVSSLSQSYQIDQSRIETELEVEQIRLDINTAIPIGLILNELVTNAFKYAFEGRERGKLFIGLWHKGHTLILEVRDDGVGLKEGFDLADNNSFGLKLVRSLTKKLKGEIQMESDQGTRTLLTIKDFDIV